MYKRKICTGCFSANGFVLALEGRTSSFIIFSKHAELILHTFCQSCDVKGQCLSPHGFYLSPRVTFGVTAFDHILLEWFSSVTLWCFPGKFAGVGGEV